MANKFILVPEEIYRGLTSHNISEPNLDFTRGAVENAKRKKEPLSAKNIHYNQELRRYLQLRNENENKPVKVQMVANPKGAIVSTNVNRPATNINEEGDEDFWISDDISYSSYPKEPPALAYNIVPPLSSSSSLQRGLNKRHKRLLREGYSSTPVNHRLKTKRKINSEKNSEQDKKRKIVAEQDEVRRRQIKMRMEDRRLLERTRNKKNNSKKVRVPPNLVNEINVSDAINAPLVPNSPNIPEGINAPLVSEQIPPRDITKRAKLEDFVSTKRWKKGYDTDKEAKINREKKKREYLQRKIKIREQKFPIDQAALFQMRKEDDARRRQKLKRKLEGPDESPLIALKRVKPVSKQQSAKAGREWMLRLIKAKRKEAGIKRFKPTLW